jgi:pimeloyl-ACP methyl ester carboxylesterase
MNAIEQVRPTPGTEGKRQQPTLVFIHGFLDGATAWDEVVTALGDQAANALCIDLPGMGSRTGESGPYSLTHFAQDVAMQINALARPVVLVGQSMGAQIAELVAGQLREKVRGLVLLTPVPLRGTGLPDEAMNTFHALGGNPSAQRDLRRQLSVNLDNARLEKLGQLGDRVNASRVGMFADIWNRGHPLGAQHAQYNGPVLIVRGEGDPFVTEEMVSGSVFPRFKNPTVVSIDKAGHWPHVEQPEAVASIVGEFLAAVGQTTGRGVTQQAWPRAFEQRSADDGD